MTFLIAYGVAALICLRPLAGHFAWSVMAASKRAYPYTNRQVAEPRPGDWAGGVFIACCTAAIWPLALAWVVVGRVMPAVGAERAGELKRAQDRVQQLERELDLAGDREAATRNVALSDLRALALRSYR